jgi:predicted esterase
MTRLFRASWLAVAVTILTASQIQAQPERYELGRRLRAFEQAWEKATPDNRKACLPGLPKVTNQFFSLQLGEAGRTLDEARWLAAGTKPSDAVKWAESFYAVPEKRLVAGDVEAIEVKVAAFYDAKPDAKAIVRLCWNDGTAVETNLGKLPAKLRVPMTNHKLVGTDGLLSVSIALDGETQAQQVVMVSWVPKLTERMKALEAGVTEFLKTHTPTLETATLRDRIELLTQLADGTVQETDIPAARLLEEAEAALAKLTDKSGFYNAEKTGQFWLTVPLAKKATAPIRIFVPKNLDRSKPVPCVVALHGAGGSENLFFEGYGMGHIVTECEKRGWILIAPRSGFFGAPPVKDILAALADRYPINMKAVFLVGHSMGAGQAAELVQQTPGDFRAVALLGGAARIRNVEALKELPIFLGVGTKDQLAYTGTKTLAERLRKAEVKNLVSKEYPDIEHMVIVRVALPDVFAEWDKMLK